ncbi:hypothetical protein G6F57_021099 [Rhizopus arrhizus]|nr:hypothetical protein G6F57_021099 [Rhizopus arrhizus]
MKKLTTSSTTSRCPRWDWLNDYTHGGSTQIKARFQRGVIESAITDEHALTCLDVAHSCTNTTREIHVQPLPNPEGRRAAAQEVRRAREAGRDRQVRHVAALPRRLCAPAGRA